MTTDLIAALAAAPGPSRELDERIAVEVFGWKIEKPHGSDPGYFTRDSDHRWYVDPPAYTASLDAITGAVREKWSDVGWDLQSGGHAWIGKLSEPARHSVVARSPALALCLAAARLALAETDAR